MTLHLPLKLPLLVVLIAILLQACSNSGSGDSINTDTSLTISASDLYWGTRSVGQQSEQQFTVRNRGSNAVRIKSVGIEGSHSDEFESSMQGPVTLQPGDAISIIVAFAPKAEGRKYASLQIDYEAL